MKYKIVDKNGKRLSYEEVTIEEEEEFFNELIKNVLSSIDYLVFDALDRSSQLGVDYQQFKTMDEVIGILKDMVLTLEEGTISSSLSEASPQQNKVILELLRIRIPYSLMGKVSGAIAVEATNILEEIYGATQ